MIAVRYSHADIGGTRSQKRSPHIFPLEYGSPLTVVRYSADTLQGVVQTGTTMPRLLPLMYLEFVQLCYSNFAMALTQKIRVDDFDSDSGETSTSRFDALGVCIALCN